MVKRKVSSNGDVKSNKKAKNVDVNMGNIKCTSPKNAISSLLSPNNIQEFFDTYWEKKPLHIKRDDQAFYGDLLSLEKLKEMLDEHEMDFESDINVCRYVNGEKELLNDEGRVTVKKFDKLMKDKKATFQVHQPQRYNEGLWNLMEKMETYFGSLVGSNVYITPAGAQGLAPHCDDVEIFVLQIEGKKTWKLYKPMVELSRDYTQDLLQDSIGEAIFEETLEPGDLLYFPRGTIHQAKTTSDGPSTHVSISTYQQNTWGDFMQHAVTQAIENALEDDVSFRTGLPLNYMKFLGTSRNMSKYVVEEGEEEKKEEKISNEDDEKVKEFKEMIKKHLSKLIDHIDVNTAADAMCNDFMGNRLPPFGHDIDKEDGEDEEAEKIPSLEDEIKLRYPEHVRVVFVADDDEESVDVSQIDDDEDQSDTEEIEEDEKQANLEEKSKKGTPKQKSKSDVDTEDEEDDEDANPAEEVPYIKIVHSLNNGRESHMIGVDLSDAAGALKLPVHFAKAATKFCNSSDQFIRVKDLDLEDDQDKMTLVTTLYADALIKMKSET